MRPPRDGSPPVSMPGAAESIGAGEKICGRQSGITAGQAESRGHQRVGPGLYPRPDNRDQDSNARAYRSDDVPPTFRTGLKECDQKKRVSRPERSKDSPKDLILVPAKCPNPAKLFSH